MIEGRTYKIKKLTRYSSRYCCWVTPMNKYAGTIFVYKNEMKQSEHTFIYKEWFFANEWVDEVGVYNVMLETVLNNIK